MGFLVLFGLSALALLAALAIAVRAQLRGRAEAVVAITLLWNALIVLPIYVLGLVRHLTPVTLAVASILTSSAAVALVARGPGLPDVLRASGVLMLAILRMPVDAFLLAVRPLRFTVVGVVFAGLILAYLALCAYFGNPFPTWDPLWYHDPIVGFTIQNHGFAVVDLPDSLQKINGYVRLGEMTQLWLVIFTDRRLADIANLLFAPAIVASVYCMSRRYTRPVMAMGWGLATVLMPACLSILHGTYVDPQNAGLMLGGIVFATLDRPRMRDAWLASLGLTLALGSKGLSLVPVPVAALCATVLLVRAHWQFRRREVMVTLAGGALMMVAMASVTYLHNYFAFHNPFWPDLTVNLPALHIHWPGMGPWVSDAGRGQPVNLNEPFPRLMDHLFALPWSVHGMFFDQAVDYGIGITWVAMPLGALAFFGCLVVALRRRLGHTSALLQSRPPLAETIILLSMIVGSPALWGPRYHTAAVGLMVTLVGWLTARPFWKRLEEPAVAMVLVTSVMMFWWVPSPHWWMTPDRLLKLVGMPAAEREIDHEGWSTALTETLRTRDKELGPGTLLVFNERYYGYPSIFWNSKFSNRVMYMKSGPDYVERATKAGATWIFLDDGDAQVKTVRAPGSGWQEVGNLNPIRSGTAYRRIAPTPGKPAAPTASPPAPLAPLPTMGPPYVPGPPGAPKPAKVTPPPAPAQKPKGAPAAPAPPLPHAPGRLTGAPHRPPGAPPAARP